MADSGDGHRVWRLSKLRETLDASIRVNRHGDVTPQICVKSVAWHADRHPDPTPINTRLARLRL